MNDLNELYQEVILDHNKSPRNFKKLENPTSTIEGFNPLCGDHYTIELKIENNIITDIGFSGAGCAISKSSASIMTSSVKGKDILFAKELFSKMIELFTGKNLNQNFTENESLASFSGVSEFPARVKCASLPWHTLIAAIDGKKENISTE